MVAFLLVLSILVFIFLLVIAAMTPHRPALSLYELERRVVSGDHVAKVSLRQQFGANSIAGLLELITNILLIVLSFTLIASLGWAIGCISIITILLLFRVISKLKAIRKIAAWFYDKIETKLLSWVENKAWLRTIVNSNTYNRHPFRIGSRDELQHLIDKSDDIVSPEVKKLLVNGLLFNDKLVRDIMSPVEQITSLKKSEFLGPLTLDELHKSGHSRLPVIGADIDHVVGILHLDSLLALDNKRSVTAEKAMDTHVNYVHQDQTLPALLAALLRAHQHIFIVIDESRRTKGIVTIVDVIEELIGRKITDDFDGNESLRIV